MDLMILPVGGDTEQYYISWAFLCECVRIVFEVRSKPGLVVHSADLAFKVHSEKKKDGYKIEPYGWIANRYVPDFD